MKKLMILFLAICPFYLKAQNTIPADIDGKTPLYVLDGKPAEKPALANVNAADIVDVSILKDAGATAPFGAKGANGVVSVVTKKFAVAAYQEAFSMFSDDFESYLTGHGTDDDRIAYYIDDVLVKKDSKGIATLYKLAKNKEGIESAVMVQDEPEGSAIAAKIKITTKK